MNHKSSFRVKEATSITAFLSNRPPTDAVLLPYPGPIASHTHWKEEFLRNHQTGNKQHSYTHLNAKCALFLLSLSLSLSLTHSHIKLLLFNSTFTNFTTFTSITSIQNVQLYLKVFTFNCTPGECQPRDPE